MSPTVTEPAVMRPRRFSAKRLTIAGVALGVAAVALTIFLRLRDEPVYEKKRLSRWVAELSAANGATARAAEKALRQIGPRALPFLARQLDASTPPPVLSAMQWLTRATGRPLPFRPATDNQGNAVHAFYLLAGTPDSSSASQEAVRILSNTIKHPAKASNAAQALMCLGASSEPVLLSALDEGPNEVRMNAVLALIRLRLPPPQRSVGVIHQTSPFSGRPIMLCTFAVSDADWPNFTAALKHPNVALRRETVNLLGTYGPAAKPMVPDLVSCLEDKELSVQHAARVALLEIEPEVFLAPGALK